MFAVLANLSFRWKIALPIALLALVLVVVAVNGIRGVNSVADHGGQLGLRDMPGAVLLLEADRDMYQAFLAERSLILATDPQIQQAIRGESRENLDQARDRVKKAEELLNNPAFKDEFQRFHQQFQTWRGITESVVAMAGKDVAQAQQMTMTQGFDSFSAARGTLDKISEQVSETARTAAKEVAAEAEAVAWSQTIALLVGLGFCVALIIGFPALLTTRMHGLLERVENIASGKGDLTVRVNADGKDELARLGAALNRFLDTLQNLIRQVGNTTRDVAGSTDQLVAMAGENSRLIAESHLSVDQVSTAATQMSSAIHEVSRNAQAAADTAQVAEQKTEAGGRVVKETISALSELAREVAGASQAIGELEKETGNIGAVLEVIKGIAEQTNLLALNAAIEAARAGEQGRGFAVVADEVRALAARTQESTKDIQTMIERLQQGAQHAVKVMQNGSSRAEASVKQASQAEVVLSEAIAAVNGINERAAQIATACEQQSSVTEEIARNITDVRDMSDRSAQTSSEATEACRHLAQMADSLEQQVSRFKV
ncbi:methyl-accepting chemotaxis protein [Atopomonas sediminilitoris]|uniref:methyl-accepting chemotaxis protein n=1 Tax=Atopomonas sediminilitoris TaxID=2919919 RepID=UPI001F4E4F52|nr:methyl-accepting chemotaxis protein [Atopomonas sediminilitoris]MCJ8167896.1 methyl-accepting chemotaxis protein [Atopomonas sediminilitoris]